ncbi:MAG: V-type ATP synthase, subunit I [Candidatus Syntrophoarchaeum caldarius]|uniref:A-type ATP synthase subunit I n=1 Tax=Candidatus Syntropharchaeum caldarium TaxID=1838285 RepID=A0A1F2P7J1_9EURY|nr:MAG: V-type ATP synthase, subunit I [Candidatus Syntrophoarchaeum caldarius]
MKRIQAVVLDEYTNEVVKSLEKAGVIHLTNITEDLERWEGLLTPYTHDETIARTSELFTRINTILEHLGEKEEQGIISRLFKGTEIQRTKVEDKPLGGHTATIESTFGEIEKRVLDINSRLESVKDELSTAYFTNRILKVLEKLNLDPDYIGAFTFTSTIAGLLPAQNIPDVEAFLNENIGEEFIMIREDLEGGAESLIIVTSLAERRDDIYKFLRIVDFEEFAPSPELPGAIKDAMEKITPTIETLENEVKSLQAELVEIRDSKLDELLMMRELVEIEDSTLRSKLNFGSTDMVNVLEGWIPAKRVADAEGAIKKASEGYCIIDVAEPTDEELPPTQLQNPRFAKPYEMMVEMFGVPNYREFDPTLLMAVIFPIFFAFMFPDVGHGFVVLLLGLLVGVFMKGIGPSMRDLGLIMIPCGIASMITGALFGEIFGWGEAAEAFIGEQVHPLMEPLWFDPILEAHSPIIFGITSGVVAFFVITLIFGGLHLTFGVILDIINRIKTKRSPLYPVLCLWFYSGFFYWLMYLVVNGNLYMKADLYIWMAIPLAIVSVEGVLEARHESKKSGVSGGAMDAVSWLLGGIIEALDVFSKFLSNTISYGRILAMALAHVCLMVLTILIAYMLVDISVIGPILFILIIIAGNIVVIGLEVLLVSIQTIRLHFYEFFTKFYDATGIAYQPLKVERVYTEE